MLLVSPVLKYINAGHNPPYWLQRGKEAEKLKSTGMAIGIMPHEYKSSEIKISETYNNIYSVSIRTKRISKDCWSDWTTVFFDNNKIVGIKRK